MKERKIPTSVRFSNDVKTRALDEAESEKVSKINFNDNKLRSRPSSVAVLDS